MANAQHSTGNGPSEFEGRKPDIWNAVARFRDGEQRLIAGQMLLAEAHSFSGLFQDTQGWLVSYRPNYAGPREILQFGLPGAVIGNHEATASFSVWALTDATVSVVSAANLLALSQEVPSVAERLRALVAHPHRFVFELMPDTSLLPPQRVSQLLLELFIRMRAQWPDHSAEYMRLPLSNDQISSACGIGNAGSILRELENKGMLKVDGTGIAVLDPDQLVDAAGVDLGSVHGFLRA